MAVARATLTPWEEHQLKSVELFFKRVTDAMQYFKTNEENLRRGGAGREEERGFEEGQQDWLKFREIVMDLYSALDYTWYLLYCHFSNAGQPDLSEKCVQLGFPYRKKGVKVCHESPSHDQTKKFAKEKMKLIWGDKFDESSHFWGEISEAILEIQPKDVVDSSGASVGGVCSQPGDEESFALLHFYRNCAAHRDLIKFMPKKSWVQINQKTREIKLVNKKHENKNGFYHIELETGYWIQLPEKLCNHGDTGRFLMEVLEQLLKSVKKTTDKLLHSACLVPTTGIVPEPVATISVPKAYVVSKGPYQTCSEVLKSEELPTEVLDFVSHHVKATSGEESVSNYQTKGASNIVEMVTESGAKSAIDEGVRLGLIQLQEVKWTLPPQTLKKPANKTNRSLLNEFKQRLSNQNMAVEFSFSPHTALEEAGRFQTDMTLNITSVKDKLHMLQVYSRKQKGLGKKGAEEAAATVVLEELIEKKIIEVKEV